MPLTGGLAYPLGAPPRSLSAEEVTDLIFQLLPVGAARMYGLRARSGDPYNFFAAIGDSIKAYWYDYIAVLRAEINPATTGFKLAEWENALGLSQTPVALTGTTPARRSQIISKLREQGAFTVANIQAVLAPLLGYANASQLNIVEMSRAALTAAHTYSSAGSTIASGGNATYTVYVPDDGSVSDGGIYLTLPITCPNPENVAVTLTSPSGITGTAGAGYGGAAKSYAWPAGTLAGLSSPFALRAQGVFEGVFVTGVWSLLINAGVQGGGGGNAVVGTWSLFVEGGGARDAAGNSGLGEQINDWCVQFNPGIGSSPAFAAARAALARMAPAHTNPTLVQNTTAVPSSSLIPPFLVMNS